MDFTEMEKKVNVKMDKKRFEHTKRVVRKAEYLAKLYNAPINKVKIGAYLHDIAKGYKLSEMLDIIKDKYPEVCDEKFQNIQILHGFVAAELAEKEFGIHDEDILNSLRYHTIGRPGMSLIEKIVYLADAIEDEREWAGIKKARKLADKNIDKAIMYELDKKIEYLIKKEALIHPNTIDLRNDLLTKRK